MQIIQMSIAWKKHQGYANTNDYTANINSYFGIIKCPKESVRRCRCGPYVIPATLWLQHSPLLFMVNTTNIYISINPYFKDTETLKTLKLR